MESSVHLLLQLTIKFLNIIMQESQHDAHYSSQDWEVVHCFQVRYVEHHNMLEAASLRADAIQDLTQQLPAKTSFSARTAFRPTQHYEP
jgi:hypothetical protein